MWRRREYVEGNEEGNEGEQQLRTSLLPGNPLLLLDTVCSSLRWLQACCLPRGSRYVTLPWPELASARLELGPSRGDPRRGMRGDSGIGGSGGGAWQAQMQK